jgi:hypothetical protein
VFNEHVVTCFIDDAFGVASRDFLAKDMICWECDYPHSDSTWPTAPETFMKQMDGVSDDDINAISHRNAIRLFSFDAFSHRRPEECTVGALRREAAGHDVSIVAKGRRGTGAAPTKAADLGRMTSSGGNA